MENKQIWFTLLSVLTTTFLVHMNSTMVVVGLSTIGKSMNVSSSEAVWFITIYLVVMAVMHPIAGKLGDVFGVRNIYLIGIILFSLSTAACSLSTGYVHLLLFRALQGIGYAMIASNTGAIIRHTIVQNKLGRAFGIYSFVISIGGAVGLFIGGILIDLFNWPSIFWTIIPVLFISLIVSALFVPNISSEHVRFADITGSLYTAAILFLIVLLLNPVFFSPLFLLFVFVILSLIIWKVIRLNRLMVPFSFFSISAFRKTTILIFITNLMMYSALLILPHVMETEMSLSVNDRGILLSIFSFVMSFSTIFGGYIADFSNQRLPIIVSYISGIASFFLYFGIHYGTSHFYLITILILGGISGGIGIAVIQSAHSKSVSKADAGAASGIFMTARYMGGIFASCLYSLLIYKLNAYYSILITIGAIGVILGLSSEGGHDVKKEDKSSA